MPLYVMDDGCIFHTVKNAVNGNITPGNVSDYEENISKVRTLVESEFDKKVYISDDYAYYKINEKCIYEHLSSSQNTNLRDSFLSLFITLERLTKFKSELYLNNSAFAIDNFFASGFIQDKFSGFISNRDVVDSDWWNASLHRKLDCQDRAIEIFKEKLLLEKADYQSIFEYKHLFWPNCYFHIGTTNRFSNLCVPEVPNLPLLVSHLDFLDKEAKDLYKTCAQPDRFKAEASVKGIDLSPESTKTHKNRAAMAQRKITINGKEILCEWHTKLSATTGRVHYCLNFSEPSEISEIVNGRVIIGIFAEHLDT
ncbi:hypothetical protein AB9R84_06420 [Oceanimonas smirnovii]|uniref:hypothetical protein n=1 Tax=Oceanimonas smirnovii TaxID=264574 RepID=UPI003AB07B33